MLGIGILSIQLYIKLVSYTMTKEIKFAAIDFETACGKRDSATSVGIVTFLNGEIIDEYNQLIRPPNNFHKPFNVQLTGITPKMTATAPMFFKVYPEIKKRLDGLYVIAHNESFDRSVMKGCMETANIPLNDLKVPAKWICTRSIYKKHYKEPKCSLGDLAPKFDINLDHHEAISDARACGWLYHKYLTEQGVYAKV